tara:strand:- start:42660 stop:43922 length:1263 start_codon:yes stop_codon:yes gene_type:complete
MTMGQILVKSEYNPRQYESRSLLGEAIKNRADSIVKQWETNAIYNGPERAAVEVMYKHQATHNEIAWVLAGDNITKSNEVYAYIDNVLKAAGQGLQGLPSTMTGPKNEAGNPTQSHVQDNPLGLGQGWEGQGLGGQATPAGGQAAQTNPQAAQEPPQAAQKPGLGSRFKTWATERAAPAAARGLRHLGAFTAGGMAAGPAGALAGLGGSMYQSHKAKQRGDYGKVMGGEGGLNQLAGDAGKQAGQAAANFGRQQAQNFQTGQGAMGKVGQAAMAGGNLAGAAGRGIASAAGAVAKPFQDAWSQAGQQQAQNAAAMQGGQQQPQAQQPQQIPGVGGAPNPNVQGGAQPQPDPNAQVDQQAAQDVTQQQPQQGQQGTTWNTSANQGQGMVGNQADMAQQRLMQMSSDDPSAYSTIESILKGQ